MFQLSGFYCRLKHGNSPSMSDFGALIDGKEFRDTLDSTLSVKVGNPKQDDYIHYTTSICRLLP